MKSFEKFLKSYKHPVTILSDYSKYMLYKKGKDDFVTALGEWAFAKWKKSYYFEEEYRLELCWIKLSKKQQEKEMAECLPEPGGSGISLSAIAVDCLGEEEVRKRLEAM